MNIQKNRMKFLLFLFLPLIYPKAEELNLKKFLEEKNVFTNSNLRYLEKENKIIVDMNVETADTATEKKQKMNGYIAGLHEKSCDESSAILAQYEKYKDYISYVEKSEYRDGKAYMTISARPLIESTFSLDIKVDRLKGVGKYPYLMGAGIFLNLGGIVELLDYTDSVTKKKRCLYFVDSNWLGKYVGPNILVQTFMTTIARKGLERLFIVSGHHF